MGESELVTNNILLIFKELRQTYGFTSLVHTNMKQKFGKLISLEGMDGCGKSTAREYLVKAFERANLSVVGTYEVGGTPIGKQLRNIAFTKRDDETLTPLARLLLIYAARLQHIEEVISPAILAGKHVITDRYNDTTQVYQGKLDKLEEQMRVMESTYPLRKLAMRADVTIYFKIDTDVAFNRGNKRSNVDNDVYKKDLGKANQINAQYDTILMGYKKKNPAAIYVVDANQDQDGVNKQLDAFVEMFIGLVQVGDTLVE